MSALILNRESFVTDIQYQFSQLFPFLKIEFQKKNATKSVSLNKKLSYFGMHNLETINYDFETTISSRKFIEDIKKLCQLNVSVFRKSGNLWIEVTETKDWSLARQNEEGKLFDLS